MNKKWLIICFILLCFNITGCGNKQISYDQYLKKIWVMDEISGQECDNTFSFYFTSFEDGMVIGQMKFGSEVAFPPCYYMYGTTLKGDNEYWELLGRIEHDKIICEFQPRTKNAGTLTLSFVDEDHLEVEIVFNNQNNILNEITGIYYMHSLKLSDLENDDTIFENMKECNLKTELDLWGNIQIVALQVKNKNTNLFHPELVLVDADENVLYYFCWTGYDANAQVCDMQTEDINQDGLIDIQIFARSVDLEYEKEFCYTLYQMEDGFFYTEQNMSWYDVYKDIISDWTVIKKNNELYWQLSYVSPDYEVDSYWLCDVDGNEIPELFLYSKKFNMTIVYTTYAGRMVWLAFDNIYGINQNLNEIIVQGHWYGTGGSGINEWSAYEMENNSLIQLFYMDCEDAETYAWEDGKDHYIIYNSQLEDYYYPLDDTEYNNLYLNHVASCIQVENYAKYNLNDLDGLHAIQ